MITQKALKDFLHYDPETGIFTRRFATGTAKAGDVAGGVMKTGYHRISVDGVRYYTHRLAWLYIHGEFPPNHMDHIDGDPLNNRIDNLRAVTRNENMKNMKLCSTNKSGKHGVYWHKKAGKWAARLHHKNKPIHLGLFVDFDAAVKRREDAEIEYGFHANHGRAAA